MLQDEQNKRGKVQWSDIKLFFSYSFGGLWGMFFIVLLHLVIHSTSVFVSIYLGLTLTARFKDDADVNSDDENDFVRILAILICAAIVSNIIDKVLSNIIFMSISRKLHAQMV